MSLYAYPSPLDGEVALALVWSEVTSGGVPTADLAQAGWVLTGLGLHLGLPLAAPAVTPAAVAGDPKAAAKALLAPHFASGQFSANALGGGGWLKLLQTLLPVLGQILGTLGPILGGGAAGAGS
jgi:hypothetical protein